MLPGAVVLIHTRQHLSLPHGCCPELFLRMDRSLTLITGGEVVCIRSAGSLRPLLRHTIIISPLAKNGTNLKDVLRQSSITPRSKPEKMFRSHTLHTWRKLLYQ